MRVWERDEPTPRFVAVLTHGLGEHCGRYHRLAAALVAQGAVVYGLDLPGHGLSEGERARVDDFEAVVGDLRMLLGAVRQDCPRVPTVLVGHATGALVAARYAQRHAADLSALVLSAPLVGEPTCLERMLDRAELPVVLHDLKVLSRSTTVRRSYERDPLVWRGGVKRPTVEALAQAMRAALAGQSVGRVPMLWLHGDDDRVVSRKAASAGMEVLRGAVMQSITYQGARHEVFNETNAGVVLADTVSFIRQALGL